MGNNNKPQQRKHNNQDNNNTNTPNNTNNDKQHAKVIRGFANSYGDLYQRVTEANTMYAFQFNLFLIYYFYYT